ncbi:MAG: SpoIIE family protein phosphatase [Cytophagales bacterium]|nr:SpoIIE family protein phosphatase [Cytophagales bacterium]
MRSAIHYIEQSHLPFDHRYMLMLRRHEKDFMLRKSLKYQEDFTQGIQVFKNHIRALEQGTESAPVQALLDTLSAYAAAFYQLVGVEKQIGLSDEDGLKFRLNTFSIRVDTEITQLIDQIQAENERIEAQSIAILLCLFLATTLGMSYRAYTNIKQKQTIMKANAQLAKTNDTITKGLTYGQRIQEALLPSQKYLTDIFSESFIYYKPRDIVSGDFYWFAHKGDEVVIVAADCTGHGVPGAFMSLMGNALLNHVVIEDGISEPSELLHELDQRLNATLQKNRRDRETNEGMDVAVCTVNIMKNTLCFSGARLPMFLIQKGKFIQVRGDRFAIGGHRVEGGKKFATHIFEFRPGDAFYLFSDGYQDQWGGAVKGKFLTKNFRRLIEGMAQVSFAVQPQVLQEKFEAWRGTEKQTDDVMVIGVKY